MGLIEATKTCFAKFATFSGRATRSEYWWFYLAVVLVGIVTQLVDYMLFGSTTVDVVATTDSASAAVSAETRSEPLTMIWSLVVILPLLAAGWRRAHDSGRPGWHILLPGLAAMVGFFGLLLGVAGFGLMENLGADPEKLRGAAAVMGMGGLMALAAVVIVLTIYKIILLVRPSDPNDNEYGPAPSS